MYYDILIDKTGQFIMDPKDMSANVGIVIKKQDSFFLSKIVSENDNGKTYYNAVFNAGIVLQSIMPKMQVLVRDKGIQPKDFFVFIKEYYKEDRTEKQEEMLNFYKELLEQYDDDFTWGIIAIDQTGTVLKDSVNMGEASAINYLETLMGGIVEYYCDEYIKSNCDSSIEFNVGITPWKYQIPVEGKDDNGEPTIEMEGKVLGTSQISNYFCDYLNRNFDSKFSKLLKNKIRFYQLNGLRSTDKINDFNLSINELDLRKPINRRLAEQLVMSISGTFANSYRNQKAQEAFFSFLTNNSKLVVFQENDRVHSLGIKQSIIEKDYKKFINNAIFFPKLKLNETDPVAKLDEWVKLYRAIQKENFALLEQVVVPGISALHVEEKTKLFDDVKNIIRADIRVKLDSRDEVVKWIERLEALKEFYKLLSDYKQEKEINIFGSDIYLFLANRYSNLGFTERSSQYAAKAMELSKQWNPERNQVFNIIQENSILDKFQYDIIKQHYEQASNTLELVKGNPFFTGIILSDGSIQSIVEDSELLNEVNAKMASIYLESRIVPVAHKTGELEEQLLECKKAFEVVASGFFKTWIEKKIIFSNYFRILLAANKLEEAFCVLIHSLDEQYCALRGLNYNESIKHYYSVNRIKINSDMFYDFDENGVRDKKRFRAFAFINFLTFLREYTKVYGRDSLVKALYGGIKAILEYYNRVEPEKMKGFVYPSSIIYWRIAKLNRVLGEKDLAKKHYRASLYLFSNFYSENKGICNDPRLLVIQIGIMADFLSYCYECHSDDEIGIAVYKTLLSEYYSAFKKMCESQNKNELQTRDVFKEIFEYDGELLKLSKDVVDKAVRVVPEYY